ncbi:MAG TPA: N-6 DNA methylase, partial [Gallicola sp.]|nr:N-6 DNA methylase [Gallicola sp.]
AAIVCFPGILYRGGAEQKIRKYLIDNNYIDTIIQLPSDLFFGSTISTIVMVLRKNKKQNKVLFIDASNEFVRFDTKNKLSEENIEKILETVKYRKEEKYFSKYVDQKNIVDNNYNLSINNYVKIEDTREVIDIKVLNNQIEEVVKKVDRLRKEIDKIVLELEGDTSE